MAFDVGGSGGGPKSDINVTPLVDVVLVMLVIFMVVTPLLQVSSKADIPRTPDDPIVEPPDPNQVIITINERGGIMLNQEQLQEEALGPRLEQLMKGRPTEDRIAFVSGTDNLRFGNVVRVMDIAKGAGVDRVGLIDPLPQASAL